MKWKLGISAAVAPRAVEEKIFPYLPHSTPTLLLVLDFLIIPLAFAFYCSLYRCDYRRTPQFMGLQNYADVLMDRISWRLSEDPFCLYAESGLALVLGVLLAL